MGRPLRPPADAAEVYTESRVRPRRGDISTPCVSAVAALVDEDDVFREVVPGVVDHTAVLINRRISADDALERTRSIVDFDRAGPGRSAVGGEGDQQGLIESGVSIPAHIDAVGEGSVAPVDGEIVLVIEVSSLVERDRRGLGPVDPIAGLRYHDGIRK